MRPPLTSLVQRDSLAVLPIDHTRRAVKGQVLYTTAIGDLHSALLLSRGSLST